MKKRAKYSNTLEAGNINSPYENKFFGVFLLIIGIFSLLLIVHRLASYSFEYNPEFSAIDYGRFNFLSYFTVQSNLLVCFYLFSLAFAVLGNKKAQKIAFNQLFGAFVTTYIFVTGVVYCCGIPLGFTSEFLWDNPHHFMLSFIQVYHHMIVPPFMVFLWLLPSRNYKIKYNKCWLFAIYPLVYSVVSILRGALFKPTFFAYPFYEPSFFWEMLMPNKPINLTQAYLLLMAIMPFALMLFVIIAFIFILIHNLRVKNK